MTTPRTTKQAMENDSWILKKIYNKGGKDIRVDFQSRFPRNDGKTNFASFWINRDYFARTYPRAYERFGY